MKKKEFIHDLTVKQVLGNHIAHIVVIEFQKRGVPHCHILIWIEHFDNTPRNIDIVISAEIQNKEYDPELDQLVLDKMIYGPCNEPETMYQYSCRKNHIDGPCQRNYPREFNSSTTLNEGCFPNYRRRGECKGRYAGTKNIDGNPNTYIDNQWVITYNPYLLRRYKSHINIE